MCKAGQLCQEEEVVCRDVMLCEDPRTMADWEKKYLTVAEGITDFIEDTNYTFTCLKDFYQSKYTI